jgi:predicted Zn-dependent peptidase
METIMNKTLFFSFILILLLSRISTAQFDRTKQPAPGASPSLKLPAVQRATLSNGLGIMLVEHHELPVVYMQMVIKTGSSADPLGKAGVASMTSDMIDEGTQRRTSLQLADEIDFIGAEISSNANYDGSYVNLLTLKEHLDKAMELYADVLLHPSFPASEFDRLKKELLTGLLQQKDRPDAVATNVFNARLFGKNHPYGYQISGTDETATAMLLDDVYSFYKTYYVPNNATLVVVGDITKDELVNVGEKYFASWAKADLPMASLTKPENNGTTAIYLFDKPNAPQSQIRIGDIGLQRNSEDFYAINILNQLLGSSNGRLFLNLREAKGYTYGAYAQFSLRKVEGPFFAYAGVRTDVTDSSMMEFMKELHRVRDELASEAEFAMYKNAVIQRLPRVFETPQQIAGQIGSLALYDLPDNYFDSIVEKYNAVTREDIQRVAKKYIRPDNLVIAIVGDKTTIKEKLEKLNIGTVVMCDDKGNPLTN